MAGGRAPSALALVVALGLIGCTTAPVPSAVDTAPANSVPSAPAVAAVDAGACRSRIQAADLTQDATIFAVDACQFTLAGAQAASEVLASGATGDPLWAAVWVYAASGSDPAPLRPMLQQGDPSVRAMAAAALVGFGDATGFAVLGQVTTDTGDIAGADPPETIGAFAVDVLDRYVVAPDLPTTASDWSGWLASHAPSLTYDSSAGTWSAP